MIDLPRSWAMVLMITDTPIWSTYSLIDVDVEIIFPTFCDQYVQYQTVEAVQKASVSNNSGKNENQWRTVRRDCMVVVGNGLHEERK